MTGHLSIVNNIAKSIIINFIKLYKLFISPMLGSNCRFQPTCSTYTIQALEKYGAIKGLYKGIYRILRCNPFSRGGYDPP